MLTDPDISHVADDELDRAIAERNEEMKDRKPTCRKYLPMTSEKSPPSVTGTG